MQTICWEFIKIYDFKQAAHVIFTRSTHCILTVDFCNAD